MSVLNYEIKVFFSNLRYVLHSTIIGSLKVVHRPFGPGIEPCDVGPIPSLLVNASKSKENNHGIDVLGGATSGEPISEPIFYDLEASGILRQFVVFPDSVETNAMGPLPVVPALGINYSAIIEF